MFKKAMPAQGRTPVRNQIAKLTIALMACMFFFVVGFSVFYEVKKAKREESHNYGISIHTTDIA